VTAACTGGVHRRRALLCRSFTAQLKANGVRVIWPYLTWDTGTRREAEYADDASTVAALLRETGGQCPLFQCLWHSRLANTLFACAWNNTSPCAASTRTRAQFAHTPNTSHISHTLMHHRVLG